MLGKITIEMDTKTVNRALTDKNTARSFPDTPLVNCPGCGLLLPDFDGFGILAHFRPQGATGDIWDKMPAPCGYCSHPSSDYHEGCGWVCGICGAVKGSPIWDKAKETNR